jgi:hypothetical protein
MLGTSANAMAKMGALVERYGPAPNAEGQKSQQNT